MGVFPPTASRPQPRACLPHVRGGVSSIKQGISPGESSSPRAWGCFFCGLFLLCLCSVFPTCVGVFPLQRTGKAQKACLPHVRGGVSLLPALHLCSSQSSPRAWGCFSKIWTPVADMMVFPTCVGVFPALPCPWMWSAGLPHVRGGVSVGNKIKEDVPGSSPRAWGCFFLPSSVLPQGCVFPTCVGVFLSRQGQCSPI